MRNQDLNIRGQYIAHTSDGRTRARQRLNLACIVAVSEHEALRRANFVFVVARFEFLNVSIVLVLIINYTIHFYYNSIFNDIYIQLNADMRKVNALFL